MAYSDTQIEAAVVACTEPSKPPTKYQVWTLTQMAESSERAREKIQDLLYMRLASSSSYHWREVEHTLVVIQQCVFIASLAFVGFFKDRTYAIAALTNFNHRAATATNSNRVQQKAKRLLELLQNDAKLWEERKKCCVPAHRGSVDYTRFQERPWIPPEARGQNSPRLTSETARGVTVSPSLPTPEPSPVRKVTPIEPPTQRHDGDSNESGEESDAKATILVEIDKAVRTATQNTPSEITKDQLDDIVAQTFDDYGRQVVISVLADRLIVHKDQHAYRHLVKALRILDHCLRNGCPTFREWFRQRRDLILPLRTSPSVQAVNELAQIVLDRLDQDDSIEETPVIRQTPTPPPSRSRYQPPRSVTKDSPPIPLHRPVKDLTSFVTPIDHHPLFSGGYSFVYMAWMSVGNSTEMVAKKVLRSNGISPQRLEKASDTRLNREIHTWTNLRHKNIASFYGITREPNGLVGLISPFFANGNIVDYIKKRDKSELDILKFMRDVVEGVAYLHGGGVSHGDIKGSNIMVDDEGNAKLIDFGVSRITDESGYTTSGPGFSWAWAAPELIPFDDKPVVKTTASDVYALGITLVEIMTGNPPQNGGKNLGAILLKVQQDSDPERPTPEAYFYPGDRLWALLLCCWAYRPEERPTIETIQEHLEELADVSEN